MSLIFLTLYIETNKQLCIHLTFGWFMLYGRKRNKCRIPLRRVKKKTRTACVPLRGSGQVWNEARSQKISRKSFYKQFFNLDVTHVHNIPGLSDWVVSG